MARNYIDEFLSLTNQKVDNNKIDIAKTITRLRIIAQLTELNETEDIDLQTICIPKKTSLTGSKSDYPKVVTGFLMVKPRSAMRGFFLPKNNFSMEYKRLFAPS